MPLVQDLQKQVSRQKVVGAEKVRKTMKLEKCVLPPDVSATSLAIAAQCLLSATIEAAVMNMVN
jgi:hypothetical protein